MWQWKEEGNLICIAWPSRTKEWEELSQDGNETSSQMQSGEKIELIKAIFNCQIWLLLFAKKSEMTLTSNFPTAVSDVTTSKATSESQLALSSNIQSS